MTHATRRGTRVAAVALACIGWLWAPGCTEHQEPHERDVHRGPPRPEEYRPHGDHGPRDQHEPYDARDHRRGHDYRGGGYHY